MRSLKRESERREPAFHWRMERFAVFSGRGRSASDVAKVALAERWSSERGRCGAGEYEQCCSGFAGVFGGVVDEVAFTFAAFEFAHFVGQTKIGDDERSMRLMAAEGGSFEVERRLGVDDSGCRSRSC